MNFIDSHCHIDGEAFDADRDEIVENAKKAGVEPVEDLEPLGVRDVQREAFVRQIKTAKQLKLPIIIHSRDADEETVEILTRECSYPNFKGIMHCFGGTAEMAKALMEIGFLISFAGNVTFKKADNLRAAARVVPLEKLLIETDCPFLTPVPFRGKRNEPAFVVQTARFLADFYEIELETLADRTTRNFLEFFDLSITN